MISVSTPSIPDLNHADQSSLNELMKVWRDKRRRNNLRAGFYDMKNATRHLLASSAPDVVKNRSFVLGWSSTAVDKLNRRINVEGFYDRSVSGYDLANFGMDEISDANRLPSEISQSGVSSLIHACSFLVTTAGDESAGEPKAIITGRDALTASAVWDTRRRVVGKFLSLNETDENGEPINMTMYLPNRIISMVKEGGKWSVDAYGHSDGVPVDPVRYKPRYARPLGQSRISRACMSIHEQAISTMARADVNGEAYSLPRYVLLGATESAFQHADGSPKPSWQAAWDAVWAIGDDFKAPEGLERADVKQFHGQSPEPQNSHLRMLAQMFSGETGIPLGELGIIGDANPTSYEALIASRDDIISEADHTIDAWQPDISSAIHRALKIHNDGDLPDDLRPTVRFRPTQHTSRASAADAGQKIIATMPWLAETDVGLELLGLNDEQIRRAKAQRDRAQGRINLGEILQRVGADANELSGAGDDDTA